MIEISGIVIHGDGFGRILGFPTANIDRRSYSRRKLNVTFGVYAGTAAYKLRTKSYKLYPAAIVIGPFDKKGLPKLEAHLIGFDGDLYGKRLRIELGKFIRPFKKYEGINELKLAIKRDIQTIKKLKI